MKNADPDAENGDSAAEAQELLNTLKDSMEQNGGTHCDNQGLPSWYQLHTPPETPTLLAVLTDSSLDRISIQSPSVNFKFGESGAE